MDVQIGNLAPSTTAKALKKLLRPKLASYGVKTFDLVKPRGKNFAFVTIPEVRIAEQFLRDYGRKGALFHGNPLIVRRGHKVPDASHIEGLQNRARDIIAKLPSNPGKIAKFLTTTTSCGVCTYDSKGQFAYRPEWTDARVGMAVLGSRNMTLATPLYDPKAPEQSTLIKIAYTSVELIVSYGRPTPSLTLILNTPPKAYHLPKEATDIAEILANLVLNGDLDKPRRVRGAVASHERIFATCQAYRVHFSPDDWYMVRSFLTRRSSYVPPTLEQYMPAVSEPISFLDEKKTFLSQLAGSTEMTFEAKFQIQRLVTNAYLLPATVSRLLGDIQQLGQAFNMAVVAQALRQFATTIPFPSPVNPAASFTTEHLKKSLEDCIEHVEVSPASRFTLSQKYEHLFLVHRAVVTPAGVFLTGPDLEPVNRVLREYSDFASSHFLRVNFQDEDGDPIQYDRNNSLEYIHDRWFKAVLEKGIWIAGQTFSFLGFSNSSLKDQSCWFMAPFWRNGQHYTAPSLIKSLGDFSHLRAPAKYAARIGQAFSDTPGGAVDLSSTRIELLPDVERNSHCFSDGCGTISLDLAKKVWKTYKRNCRPTLFQIRYAGAKGMVSLDNRLEGDVLCIRPSMLKFQSTHNKLEICNAARRGLPFYLNRQLVKILEDLGVSHEAFHRLQELAVSEVRSAASSPTKTAAFLDRKGVGTGCNLSWLIERLSEIGIDARDDMFLQGALEHAMLSELRMIKHKARIPVENGHTLYGVMDETGVLRENQIFVRVDGKVRTGLVAITRSPALHPGDIQLARAEAVAVSASSPLMALDCCVVFSQLGVRDLPSMLSGGDLDGDLYNIIFDPTLLPRRTYKPAAYKRPTPIDLYREMGMQDMTDWFIKFMKNDHLAKIAIGHVQLADHYPEGTLHSDCLKLAELHSTAVDFQKTGVEVQMSNFPKLTKARPHYMAPDPRMLRDMDMPTGFDEDEVVASDDEDGPDAALNPDAGKSRILYYHSSKILGQLYDKIDERAFLREIDTVLPSPRGCIAMQRLWQYIQDRTRGFQWQHMRDFAWNIREEYEALVVDLMIQHRHSPRETLSELEVFMGSIIGKDGALPTRKVRDESFNMKDEFNDGISYITRCIVHGNVDGLGDVELSTEIDWADMSAARDQALERSMACLAVSLEEGPRWDGLRNSGKLRSFQYVAGMLALRELTIFEKRNATHISGLPIWTG